MEIDAVVVLAVLAVMLVALARELASAPAIMIGGLVVLVVIGVVPPDRAFAGFSSSATVSIAGLFVVAGAVRDHVVLDRVLAGLLGDGRRGDRSTLVRLLPPIALLSGVVNNTPLVATSAPIVRRWAEHHGVASSRLLAPVSFAAILGGSLTTIGTSTTLVVSGALEATGRAPLGLFALAPASVPATVIGLGLLVLFAPNVLPDRRNAEKVVGDPLAVARWPRSAQAERAAMDPPPLPADAAWASMPRARRRDARLTVVTVPCMVGLAATGRVPTVTAILLACIVLVAAGVIEFRRALEAIHLDVLLVVAAAIGLGVAVEISGLADVLADVTGQLATGRHAAVGLAVIVVGTLLLTELITNVAAAALIVPIAVDVAEAVGADPTGYAVAVALAASASFLTPIGYQTNTIVYGIGGYRFGDFWRLGLPLTLTVVAVAVVMIPRVWG